MFVLQPQSNIVPPQTWKKEIPLKPFFVDRHDLLHSKQEWWECLLLAYRAAVRSRVPSLDTFLENLRTFGTIVNVNECAESGIPILFLRMWMSHFCGMFRLQTIRKHQWNSRSEVQKFFANQVCLYFWSCINFALNQTGVYLVCLRIRDSNNRQCQHWIAVDTAALRLSDSMKERTESFDTVEYWNRPHILAVLQVIQVMVQVN